MGGGVSQTRLFVGEVAHARCSVLRHARDSRVRAAVFRNVRVGDDVAAHVVVDLDATSARDVLQMLLRLFELGASTFGQRLQRGEGAAAVAAGGSDITVTQTSKSQMYW